MSHPFHRIAVSDDGSLLYVATAQQLVLVGNLDSSALVVASYKVEVEPKDRAPNRPKKPEDEIKAHIQTLMFSRNKKYLIGTTNEDKLAIVWNAHDLSVVSKRSFPKRPSAVATTPDDETLVLGDKFGDVYAVPLTSSEQIAFSEEEPSANGGPILGHVSMLVDVAMASNNGVSFIITADRDEHIRVSQFPKSYNIERWLFGHREFVSCLTLLPNLPTRLVSGGGDDHLFLWDWTTGELLDQFDLRPHLIEFLRPELHAALAKSEEPNLEISISSITLIPGTNSIIVQCEGTSAVLQLNVSDRAITFSSVTHLPHVALSLSVDNSRRLFVSYDHPTELLGIWQLADNGPAEQIHESSSTQISSLAGVDKATGKLVELQVVRQLRKRGEY